MCKTNEELYKKITNENITNENMNIKYKISSIQFKLFNKVNCCLYMNIEKYTGIKTGKPPKNFLKINK